MSPSNPGQERIAGPDDAGRRLDRVLRALLAERSLSEIFSALRKGRIRVNGKKAGPELRLAEGDRIYLHPSIAVESRWAAPGPAPGTEAEDLSPIADILVLATEHLLFINKPRGELSHGKGSLEERIAEVLATRMAASLSFVPGPLHRLDRNTTGLITFPRSAEGARAFTALLRERRLVKRYLALVEGEAGRGGQWQDRIARDSASMKSAVSEGGDEASAEMRPLLSSSASSLILVTLHSGLTHQIRVQAASRAVPLAGDVKYGGRPRAGGYLLHALSLEFLDPPFLDLPRRVTAPLPREASAALSALFDPEELADALEAALGPGFGAAPRA